jgi:nitrogenase subunit NifH
MRKVAIYGGRHCANPPPPGTVAGLMEMGRRSMVVSCDPKADSTRCRWAVWPRNGSIPAEVLDESIRKAVRRYLVR